MRFSRKFLIILCLSLFIFFVFSRDIRLADSIDRIKIEVESNQAKIKNIQEKIDGLEEEILKEREVIPSPLINEYKNELTKLNTQLRENLLVYLEKHPVIKKIKLKIEYYQNKIKEEENNVLEKKVYSQNPEYLSLIKEKNALETENAGLNQKIKMLTQMIEEKKKENELQNKITENGNKTKKEDVSKNNNKIFKNIFGLILLLICFGVLFYIFKKYPLIKKKKKIKEENLLGTLPKIKKEKDVTNAGEDVILYHNPDNKCKRDFREIGEEISSKTKTFAITSLVKQTGKTFFGINMAAFWANNGKRVALIDLNFESPKIHRVFLKENSTGMADILLGNRKDVLINSVMNGLDIIPSGHNPVGAEEMLESSAFLDFIKSMEESYDYVILDMASLKESEQAYIVGKYIPLVGVVNSKKDIVTLSESAEKMNNVFLGAVLNKK